MNGPDCPVHGTPMEWLSTTNEWEFACRACDARYNRQGEKMPTRVGAAMTIFVLDDDPNRLDAFTAALGDRALLVTASTVPEAVAYFERVRDGWETRVVPPDALFLDHDLCDFTEDMVERTGQTFASWLAQHNDDERLIPRNTPIVLHSFNPAGVQAMAHILRVRGGFSPIAAIPFGPDTLSVARGLANIGVNV